MLKTVFRSEELITLPDKIIIESPSSYPELIHLKRIEEEAESLEDAEEYKGPTADDLRREAELFKTQWEEEKEKMFSGAKAEAENIIHDARDAAFAEVKRQTDEALVIKQKAELEAERVIADANFNAAEIASEVRQSLDAERKDARDQGREDGRQEGFQDGKAEVLRLTERTQSVLERAQDKRGEILKETEKQIVDLVLLITRKVVKVISENQRDVIIYNVIEALRKVKAKGDIIIKVNLADLKLATAHKQDFITMMEGVKSIQIVEDSSVDNGGCIIETDFGEIDARIASQLAEIEKRILEIAPAKSSDKDITSAIRSANLFADLAGSSKSLEDTGLAKQFAKDPLFNRATDFDNGEGDEEDRKSANAALTASAALAALATMAQKGKRQADKKMTANMESHQKRITD